MKQPSLKMLILIQLTLVTVFTRQFKWGICLKDWNEDLDDVFTEILKSQLHLSTVALAKVDVQSGGHYMLTKLTAVKIVSIGEKLGYMLEHLQSILEYFYTSKYRSNNF